MSDAATDPRSSTKYIRSDVSERNEDAVGRGRTEAGAGLWWRGARRTRRRPSGRSTAIYARRFASGNQWWQYAIVSVAVATPILGFYGALNPDPHGRSNYNWEAIYWTLGLVVLALVWFAILLVTRRDRVDGAASQAAVHPGLPPGKEALDYGQAS